MCKSLYDKLTCALQVNNVWLGHKEFMFSFLRNLHLEFSSSWNGPPPTSHGVRLLILSCHKEGRITGL